MHTAGISVSVPWCRKQPDLFSKSWRTHSLSTDVTYSSWQCPALSQHLLVSVVALVASLCLCCSSSLCLCFSLWLALPLSHAGIQAEDYRNPRGVCSLWMCHLRMLLEGDCPSFICSWDLSVDEHSIIKWWLVTISWVPVMLWMTFMETCTAGNIQMVSKCPVHCKWSLWLEKKVIRQTFSMSLSYQQTP